MSYVYKCTEIQEGKAHTQIVYPTLLIYFQIDFATSNYHHIENFSPQENEVFLVEVDVRGRNSRSGKLCLGIFEGEAHVPKGGNCSMKLEKSSLTDALLE